MKTIKFLALSFLSILAMSSCVDNLDDVRVDTGRYGKAVNATLSLHVGGELTPDGVEIPLATRVAPGVTINEDNYHNIWAFQFNGTGDNAVLVAPPSYVTAEQIAAAAGGQVSVPLIESAGAQHRLVFVANINNPHYSWNMSPGTSTLKDLKNKYIYVSSESFSHGAASQNLVMSGTTVCAVSEGAVIDDGGAGVSLTRSLAKIQLNVSVDNAKAPNFKVTSVRMRNVSSRLDLLDNMIGFAAGTPYPAKPEVVDYTAVIDASGLVAAGGSETFEWYVPRNMRGETTESTSSKTKNTYAPLYATYFEIVANDGASPVSHDVVYRIYPGADNVSDFNIEANHIYTLDLNITGDGGDTTLDSRIEKYGNVMFDGSANSFIVNPPLPGMQPREFHIPITRVNEYWRPVRLGWGSMDKDRIEANDTWEVMLLWQDNQDMVRDIDDPTYDPAKHVTLTKKTGKGGNDYFSVLVPPGAKRSNCVISIKKTTASDNTNVLWSWHLWITDYDPDVEKIDLQGDKWIYAVGDGAVYRHGGPAWGYNSPGAAVANNWNNYQYYTTTATAAAPYARSVMMDRDLGDFPDKAEPVRLAYQFGRPNPMPGATKRLYTINGTMFGQFWSAPSPAFPEQGYSSVNVSQHNVNIQTGVYNPLRFVGADGSIWMGNIFNEDWLWSDVRYTGQAANLEKSIFDPCPEGWCVPVKEAWEDFRYVQNGVSTVFDGGRDLAYSKGVVSAGVEYYPYVKNSDGNYIAKEKMFYSTTTEFNIYTTEFFSARDNIRLHGAMRGDGALSGNSLGLHISLNYTPPYMSTKSDIGKGVSAQEVRCVSMPRP